MLEGESRAVRGLFWNKQVIPHTPKPGVIVSDEESGKESGGLDDSKNGGGVDDEDELQETEPLAVILVNSIFHLLFLPGREQVISMAGCGWLSYA